MRGSFQSSSTPSACEYPSIFAAETAQCLRPGHRPTRAMAHGTFLKNAQNSEYRKHLVPRCHKRTCKSTSENSWMSPLPPSSRSVFARLHLFSPFLLRPLEILFFFFFFFFLNILFLLFLASLLLRLSSLALSPSYAHPHPTIHPAETHSEWARCTTSRAATMPTERASSWPQLGLES